MTNAPDKWVVLTVDPRRVHGSTPSAFGGNPEDKTRRDSCVNW